ncbi:serine/threonine protein kinase [Lentithecium fluviatile CBS 122367]|uniref:Serine/threonine protein kinase n=1 Tax=Lentithecium fluviatile CBS 122367 TaxID=1168545 RepID=A0A6G1J7N5_9PLEO|nr:serine/threonine protein kinase [Lentithecium fluviatile CBS 122367]
MSGLEVPLAFAGLAIGLPSLADGLQKAGKSLLERIHHVEEGYRERYLLAKAPTPDTLRDELTRLFQALRDIYEDLLSVFPAPKAGKEVIRLTKHQAKKADRALVELEDWNGRFVNRALVFKLFGASPETSHAAATDKGEGAMAPRKIQRLRDAVMETLDKTKSQSDQLLLPASRSYDSELLPDSSVYRCTPQDQAHAIFLAEYRIHSDNAPGRELQAHRKIVREIASILRQADPICMGLLHCYGFTYQALSNRFELHYTLPPDYHNPRSLLDLLTSPETRRDGPNHPLNHRIDLAKQIATALFVLHSADMVHKQIRPDNILIFEKKPNSSLSTSEQKRKSYPYTVGEPFLVGFDAVRKVDVKSQMAFVDEWQKNIYLSPERHRLQDGDEYRVQHDLYSLGVILLEIAFWASFQDKKARGVGSLIRKDDRVIGPEELKKVYLGLASGAVARSMGERYAEVVKACLTGLEEQSLEDADGITVATAYVTEVIKGLEEIKI